MSKDSITKKPPMPHRQSDEELPPYDMSSFMGIAARSDAAERRIEAAGNTADDVFGPYQLSVLQDSKISESLKKLEEGEHDKNHRESWFAKRIHNQNIEIESLSRQLAMSRFELITITQAARDYARKTSKQNALLKAMEDYTYDADTFEQDMIGMMSWAYHINNDTKQALEVPALEQEEVNND